MTTNNLLLNSLVSAPSANFMTYNIKDFYLNTPMDQYEYMHIHIKMNLKRVIDAYNLLPPIKNNHALVKIGKVMYDLPQAGNIAHDQIVKHLTNFGYFTAHNTPGMRHHKTHNIYFFLMVDEYCVKYTKKVNTENLNAYTRSPLNGLVGSTLASPSSGTTKHIYVTCPCRDI